MLQRKVRDILYDLGFAAKEHLALAEKLVASPPREKFERVVELPRGTSPDQYLGVLRKLIKTVRALDILADDLYEQLKASSSARVDPKCRQQYKQVNERLGAIFPKFRFRRIVLLEMALLADHINDKMKALVRAIEECPVVSSVIPNKRFSTGKTVASTECAGLAPGLAENPRQHQGAPGESSYNGNAARQLSELEELARMPVSEYSDPCARLKAVIDRAESPGSKDVCGQPMTHACTIELAGQAVSYRTDATRAPGDLQYFERIFIPTRFDVRFRLPEQAGAALEVLREGRFDSRRIRAERVTPVTAIPSFPDFGVESVCREWIRGRFPDRDTWERVHRIPGLDRQAERTNIEVFESGLGHEDPGYYTVTLEFTDQTHLRIRPDRVFEPKSFCTAQATAIVELLQKMADETSGRGQPGS